MDLSTVDHRSEILKAAARHAKATGRSEATIGNLIAKDRRFIPNIKKGASCTVDTFQRVMLWFKENTPSSN